MFVGTLWKRDIEKKVCSPHHPYLPHMTSEQPWSIKYKAQHLLSVSARQKIGVYYANGPLHLDEREWRDCSTSERIP